MSEQLRRNLARLLTSQRLGERLPTVRQLADRLGVSIGAVQGALAGLEEIGAIDVDRHGRSGSFLRGRSVAELWNQVGEGPLVIAYPLPASRQIEGLATALKAQILRQGIDVFSLFIRGSRKRLAGLRQGRCHIAVMSDFAAQGLCGEDEAVALTLAAQTFVREHVVLEHARARDGQRRAAADPESYDQEQITRLEFGNAIELVPTVYMQLATMVERGKSDVAVWSIDEASGRHYEDVTIRPLSEATRAALAGRDLHASLLVRADDDATQACMTELDTAAVERLQDEVMRGTCVPEY